MTITKKEENNNSVSQMAATFQSKFGFNFQLKLESEKLQMKQKKGKLFSGNRKQNYIQCNAF